MKKLLILALAALALSGPALAQTARRPQSVREYFLAIPTEYIKAEAKKRVAWIENESLEDGWLAYDVPLAELTDAAGEGRVFGTLQVFEKDAGGVLVGMANNLCADSECIGLVRFLAYDGGRWSDVSEDYMIVPDNDEVIEILKTAPAYKKPLKAGVQVPLAIEFGGAEKSIRYLAGCAKSCDGGVVAMQFKWNGESFARFDSEESPE